MAIALLFVSQPRFFSCINCLICILKLEKKLKSDIDTWEGEQGSEFLVNGQKFLEYVEEQWELYHIEKEREKQERVRTPTLCLSFTLLSAGKYL